MSEVQHFTVLRKLPSNEAIWVESATCLENALKRVQELTQEFPADDFFILDWEHSSLIVPFDGRRKQCRVH